MRQKYIRQRESTYTYIYPTGTYTVYEYEKPIAAKIQPTTGLQERARARPRARVCQYIKFDMTLYIVYWTDDKSIVKQRDHQYFNQ